EVIATLPLREGLRRNRFTTFHAKLEVVIALCPAQIFYSLIQVLDCSLRAVRIGTDIYVETVNCDVGKLIKPRILELGRHIDKLREAVVPNAKLIVQARCKVVVLAQCDQVKTLRLDVEKYRQRSR